MAIIEYKGTETNTYPKIVTEKSDGVDIGRITIPALNQTRWEPSSVFLRCFNSLNGLSSSGSWKPEEIRRHTIFNLNNNTANKRSPVAYERPVSAYFTYDPFREEVVIEWGKIDPSKEEAKLHTYLNRMIHYADREKQGMKLTSGHIARIISRDEELYLALLDSLPMTDVQILNDEPMGKLVNSLYCAGFVPIGGDGFIRLPAF